MADITKGILYTDEYQITMSQVFFRLGIHEKPALFEFFYRKNPDYGQHQAGYSVFAGLDPFLDWMTEAKVETTDLEALRAQKSRSGKPLFDEDFLSWLNKNGSFDGLSLRAVDEGRVVHPQVPLIAAEGPLVQAQLLETALLNRINFETLVATKAARVREAAGESLVLDFGLRRAPGEAGNAATRASLIGGADRSSNVGMSYALGLQAAGTHAHSLVQAFMALGMSELESFQAYAGVYPDDTVLLVDTVETLESGVPNAIKVFEDLKRKGHKPVGIRLDSGDLAYLAIQSARMLDKAGFADTLLVLSSDLDELIIWQIQTQIHQEAGRYGVDPDALIKRLVFGVGTRMVTSWGQPALGGVYKVVAVRDDGHWKPAIKVSDTMEKVLNPGHKEAWRIYDERGLATADFLSLSDEAPEKENVLTLHHPADSAKHRRITMDKSRLEALHREVWKGKRLLEPVSLSVMRERKKQDVEKLDQGVRRLVNPHVYHVSLSEKLWTLKNKLVEEVTGKQ